MEFSIGIIIPTFQGANHLKQCLPPLLQSPLKPRLLIIDSSSSDDTISISRSMGVESIIIPKHEFNHGTTRELGRKLLQTSIVVMVTQDAYFISPHMLEILVKPIIEKKASIAYGRQIPHQNANFLGSFARSFNYPATSHIRSLADVKNYGVYTFFCSNSCAAYCNQSLDEVGGFPPVLFGEDFIVVAKLLHQHHRIAYVAEAQVYHSHNYTLKQELTRHFDMGLVRYKYRDLLAVGGQDYKRGKAYTLTLLKELWKNSPFLIPYALLQSCAKYLGYFLGKRCHNAPLWIKKRLSSQKSYWKG